MPAAATIFRVGDNTVPTSTAGGVLTPGLRADYKAAYKRTYKAQVEMMSKVMDLSRKSDKAYELYAYYKSSPIIHRWDRGQGIPQDATDVVQFACPNYRWGVRVAWHKDDESDDQTGMLVERAREAGESEALLDERAFFQIITNTTDLDMLPVIPLAPDGVALASATDGTGADRFGVSGGNLIAGLPNPDGNDIRDLYYDTMTRFRRMLDTKNQPLHPVQKLQAGVLIVHGSLLSKQVKEAFLQQYPLQTANGGKAAAAPSNVIIDAGDNVQLWNSPRITDQSVHVFLTAESLKAVFRQEREAFYEAPADTGNSDSVRDTYQRYIQWTGRRGYGAFLPTGYIKWTNAAAA